MNKYNFVDDPEPKEPIENAEEKWVRKAKKHITVAAYIIVGLLVLLFISANILRKI